MAQSGTTRSKAGTFSVASKGRKLQKSRVRKKTSAAAATPTPKPESALRTRIKSGSAEPITPRERALAARIRVIADRKNGRSTPRNIAELAKGA